MLQINKIHKGDCMELMQHIPDKSVDMILCDLPYGVTAMKWDNILPIKNLWNEYERIIKPNGAIVLFCQQPFTSLLISSNIKNFRWCYTWVKNLKTNFLQAKYMPMRGYENIAVFGLNRPNYYPQMRKTKWNTTGTELETEQYKTKRRKQVKRNGECLPDDVLSFKCIHGSQKRFHKNEKPIELVRFLVRTFTQKKELVLDNCIGSGTTAIACVKENRNFIGIELSQEYVDTANKRLQQDNLHAFFQTQGVLTEPSPNRNLKENSTEFSQISADAETSLNSDIKLNLPSFLVGMEKQDV